MPELPEVEVTRLGIDLPLRGARIERVRIGKVLRWPLGVPTPRLVGARVGPVLRRGKYLWMPLIRDPAPPLPSPSRAPQPAVAEAGAGGGEPGLLWHLGMSGSLALLPAAPAPGPHDHFDLVTDRGTLRLNDPRRFGAVVFSPALDRDPASKLLARLGREPSDPALTVECFHGGLKKRRAPIKAVLLSGEVVVGAGNIYACEALFEAGIHPATRCDRLSRPRAARLLDAVRNTLQRALAAGGSTLRDFSDAHGMSGQYQQQAAVYGREGLACLRCGTGVRRIVQGQRSTFFCAGCQRR